MVLAATKAGLPVVVPPKEEILGRLSKFVLGGPGIGGWLTTATSNIVFDRLARIDADPLSMAQLHQLLVLGHQAPPSDDFLKYYWLTAPPDHPYPIARLTSFEPDFSNDTVKSLDHLAWGLERLYADSLLWWGISARGIWTCVISAPISSENFFGRPRA